MTFLFKVTFLLISLRWVKKAAKSSENIDQLKIGGKSSKSTSEQHNRLGVDSTLEHKSDDDDNLSANEDLTGNDDDFKDFDPNSQEKLFGMDLFDELPMHERRARFEETVSLTKLRMRVGAAGSNVSERLKKKIIGKL